MELAFQLSSLLVMPFWLLMVLLPAWRWTQRIITSPWIVAPAALLDTLLIVPMIADALPALMNPALAGIAELLGTPAGATISWIHFLAFDLFVGRWVYLNGRRLGQSAWLVSPIFLVVLMFGPLGLLLYLAVSRLAAGRSADIETAQSIVVSRRKRMALHTNNTATKSGTMSVTDSSGSSTTQWARALLTRAWRFNRPLTAAVILMTLLIPLPLMGMVVDPKVITGVNGWIKPLKFLVSGALYGATFLWLLTYVKGRRRLVQSAATITGTVLLAEILLIIVQVIRGSASHFNAATAFDAAVFSIMGGAITVLAIMNLLLAILLMFQHMENPVFGWALRLGVLASFVGMATAFLMTAGPTPEQLTAMRAGQEVTTIGAHSVGVPDGGPGLPLLGWSTDGGDLRVPHFFGLHGMQVIPLLGWLLTRPSARRRWNRSQRLAFVWIGGLTYIGWTLLLTWQALRAQPVLAPDVLTWMAYGLLVGTAVLATGVVLNQNHADGIAANQHGAAAS